MSPNNKLSNRQTVAERVVERVDESIKADIMHWAAFYVSIFMVFCFGFAWCTKHPDKQEVRMRLGSKKIFHLEAWVIKVMSLYKVLSR